MSAQDEFNRLVASNQDKFSSHPEDRHTSDRDSHSASDDDDDNDHDHAHHSDSEDFDPTMGTRTATYKVPRTVYDANTGPKGVIADAQAFERARKRSFRRTLLGAAGIDYGHHPKSVTDDATLLQHSSPTDGSASEEDEEQFMREWRKSRMQELQSRNLRRVSPRGKMYGSVETVDAVGYLDAIEKVASDTVVVVCVFDPESKVSSLVEDCLDTIARRQPTVHFIKLDHEIAEMDHIEAPALLVYRGGDVFATIVEIMKQIPKGRSLSADSLEDLLKSYVDPVPPSCLGSLR
ncbi:phosducin family protein [Aspergillus clavatus NRRL 1]|uniref:Phosducin, putative n=1 Tax=Aspergillus clavatus (strain ATCC 1007 / CBS 513.65 / DSM 816 / NCTC 3887 / NRRL 1 / QM 1276 / 107) TaxID=344612 RepID=A1CBG6_ASPCL|nr:phosducin, putative [Aspergillus clavatus NRRL 1]EAW13084.1 phosducin, putative [Aspergillus clavatus NRRL 1]